MSVYLKGIPLQQAQSRFLEALAEAGLDKPLGDEEIKLDEFAVGRVLADTVWAKISSPNYHAAAMDGYAVRAKDTSGAMLSSPLTLLVGNQALYIDTGNAIPDWANAVIPIENVELLGENLAEVGDIRRTHAIRIRAAAVPWQHIRSMGEDIIATQLVLPAGQIVKPVDLGAVAACGHDTIQVYRKPRVAILPTGSELVPVGSPVQVGEIIEYNSLVLAAQVNSWGGEAIRFPIIPDDFDLICSRVQEAVQVSDLVLLSAGSSAGSEDFSAKVIETLGTLLVHGIAVRPGHPVILGMLDSINEKQVDRKRKIPVIGVPGYPVSAALTSEIFVRPLILRWLGQTLNELAQVKAFFTRKVTSPAGDDDYLRVVVGRVGQRVLAAPLSRGAGVITSLVQADGITIIPRGTQGLSAGEVVTVRMHKPLEVIERTIFAIGSHDMTLDLLAQFLSERERRLVSNNVGSIGGLLALQRMEAHLAGSHLLDPESGEYNLAYVTQYLPGTPVMIINLVGRQQGLLVAKGNPINIYTLEDIIKPGVKYINRQRGAGTRVLLDYYLSSLGINPTEINGYELEEYTHLGVAVAIASGRVDCGLGIAAAANSLDLDFIPLYKERYDIVVPREYYYSDLLKPLFEVINTSRFKQSVDALPGYDTTLTGTIIAEI